MARQPLLDVRWHPMHAPAGAAEALVLYVGDPSAMAQASAFAQRWSSFAPRCAFCALETDLSLRHIALAPTQEAIAAQATALGLGASQIVLVGQAYGAQRVLDLALCGGIGHVQALILDLPPESVVLGPPVAAGALRFVQHPDARDPQHHVFERNIAVLRQFALDIRTILLPDDLDASHRAIGAFLVELVARASRDASAPFHPSGPCHPFAGMRPSKDHS